MHPALLVAQFGGDTVEELLKVDLSALRLQLSDHVENGGILTLEAETLHGRFEFAGVDFSGGFGVEQVEGLPQLLNFVLSETRSLDLLLGGALSSHSLSHNQ